MPALDTLRQLQDAQQLQRLRALRERKALQALRAAEAAQHGAEQLVRERESALQLLQQQRQQLARRVVGELAPSMARLADCVSAVQADLDDQLERTEYALIDDEEALAQARANTDAARQAWLRTVSRHGSAQTLVGDARLAVRRDRETRDEREDAPTPLPNL